MVHPDDLCDIFTADRTCVVPIEQRLRTLAARDHVVTWTQETVTMTVHADSAVVFVQCEGC